MRPALTGVVVHCRWAIQPWEQLWLPSALSQHSAAHFLDYPPLVRVASLFKQLENDVAPYPLCHNLASRSTAARHASRLFQLASELSRAAFGSSFMARLLRSGR